MNFSKNSTFSKLLSLILVLVMTTTLFTGCKKDEDAEDTSEPGLNINLSDSTAPSEPEESTAATTAPVVNENTATVTNQLNIRSMPSMDGAIVGTLYAGDRVEISRRETVTGINWAYIQDPISGWIVTDYIEMDIPTEETPGGDTSTPAGGETTPEEKDDEPAKETNIKGVINVNGLNIRSEGSTDGKRQGVYNKGDVVTILETKNGWGRTNKGWIKMEYVSTAATSTTDKDTTNKDTEKDDNKTTNIVSNGSTTVQFRGIVTASQLNVRADSSQNADKVGSMTYGDRVEILEKDGTWGRTKKGWISLNYVYQDGTTGSKTAAGTVTGSQLNIRNGPGTGYDSVGSYNKGDRVNILEQFTYNNVTWGCTNKGWISLQYVQLDGASNNTTTEESKNGTITGNGLNIRAGAGTGYDSVGTLYSGDRVTILSTTVVDGITWGKIDKGWISMAYVDLD